MHGLFIFKAYTVTKSNDDLQGLQIKSLYSCEKQTKISHKTWF